MPFDAALLEALRAIDTPTVCNALEMLDPALRTTGFNRRPLIAPFPQMKPAVGYARTAVIRCSSPPAARDQRAMRMGYYEQFERSPKPTIAVIQDADGPDRGMGAFWGEVQTNIHKALGVAGVVTDGAVRDIDQMAPGFFVLAGAIMPSHVYADVAAYDVPVTVAGMLVMPDDLIHADRHGVAVIPAALAPRLPEAAAVLARREKVLLDAAKRPGFSSADIRKALAEMDEIH